METFLRLPVVLLLWLLAVQTSAAPVQAENWLPLPAAEPQTTSRGYLQVIRDPLNQLTLDSITEHGIVFEPYPPEAFNEGFTRSGFWLKLPLDARQTPYLHWLLEINYPLLDQVTVTVHDAQGNTLKQQALGDTKPFRERLFQHRNFILPLNFALEKQQVVYLHIQTTSSVQVPIYLWEVNAFIEQRSNEQYGLGLYYGMMLVMFLYNLFLWLSIRDTSYLTYISYIAAFVLLQLATSGLGYQFLWPEHPWFQQISVPLSIGLVGIFGSIFTRGFLQTARDHRWADSALRLCIAVSVLTCAGAFVLELSTIISIGKFLVVIFLCTVLFSSVSTLAMGQHQARYFLAAWLSFIVGGLITISMMLGYLPNNLWTTHASKIGSALEIVLLSFALADRIKLLQRAKHEAEERVKHELQERTHWLAESNRLKSDFLTTVSHELRTPLNGILGSLELAGGLNGNERQDALNDARISAGEMRGLVDAILDYTELQAGQRPFRQEAVSVRELLQTTLNQVQLQSAGNGRLINFRLQLAPATPEIILTDSKYLRHALKALLEYASRYSGQSDILLEAGISSLQQKPCLELHIHVPGCTLPLEEWQQLQAYFNHPDQHSIRHQPGLSLALARSICSAMQGHIHLSDDDHRAAIQMRLPVQLSRHGHFSSAAARQPAPEREQLRGRALIVEDNTINQRVLQSMLHHLQIQTDIADNGAQALALLENAGSRYQLIFMDCQMPVMDGFEATRTLRASTLPARYCPVIAVTANAISGDEERCKQAGMDDYLSKPISKDDVQQVVQRWLHKVSPTAASEPPAGSPAQTDV